MGITAVTVICTVGLNAQEKLEKAVFGTGNYGTAGCGLGSMLMGPGDGAGQIFAATTNNTSDSQIFGITTGTSNCDAVTPTAYLQKRRETFVAVNYGQLQQEMASGRGKKIESFAALLGCSQLSAFAEMTQKNHVYFFEIPQKEPVKFIERVQSKIEANTALSSSCKVQLG